MFDYEDVTVGSWMLAMNVKHEDNRAMCDSACTPTSIAVWDSKKCSSMSWQTVFRDRSDKIVRMGKFIIADLIIYEIVLFLPFPISNIVIPDESKTNFTSDISLCRCTSYYYCILHPVIHI